MGPDPGGVPSWGLAGGTSAVGSESISMGPAGGVLAGGGRTDEVTAGQPPYTTAKFYLVKKGLKKEAHAESTPRRYPQQA